MTQQLSCPEPARLQRLLTGTLPQAEQAELTRHLDTCDRCQKTLERLAAGRDSWAEAARAIGRTLPAPDSAFWPAVKRLENQPNRTETLTEAATADDLSLDFLSPSDQPGHLGRLGEYEVLEVIGQGGMGVVLRALDTCLERQVAIKVLVGNFATNPTARKRFCREARAAAAIRHENVVAIYAVDEANGHPYLVMEYIPGISLEDHLERNGPFELPEILRIGGQTAAGLAAAHAQGLIHRDVKPANILLETGVGRVKLTDFGLARATDDAKLTQSGTVAGTPLYMAPEQARGEALDARTDLFSLGSVLYALCTGQNPFDAGSPLAVLHRITEEKPRPIPQLNPKIPDWLVEIIDRLQAKDPAERFGSATEVAELLNQHLGHLLQPSVVSMPCSPSLRRRKRRRLATGAALLGLIGGLALSEAVRLTNLPGLIASAWHGGNEQAARDAGEGPASLARATLHVSAGPVWSLAFAPDGTTLAMGSDDGTVKLWDVPAGRFRATLNAHHGPIWAVAFARRGTLLATASDDGTAKLWDVTTGQELRTFKHQTAVRGVALTADGSRLVSGCRDGSIRIWDTATGKPTVTTAGHSRNVMAVAFAPDDKTVASASGDKTVKIWDAVTGQEQISLQDHTGSVYTIAFAPDGKTLASGGWDRTVRLWDAGTGNPRAALQGHREDVWSVAFSPDSRLLASGSEDRTVKVWDVATGRELATYRGHAGTVFTVAFAPDGKTIVSGGRNGTVMFWDVPSN